MIADFLSNITNEKMLKRVLKNLKQPYLDSSIFWIKTETASNITIYRKIILKFDTPYYYFYYICMKLWCAVFLGMPNSVENIVTNNIKLQTTLQWTM